MSKTEKLTRTAQHIQTDLTAFLTKILARKAGEEGILICDDDENFRAFFKTILKDTGHKILEARDGEECIKILERESPSLLFLDLVMPGVSGFDVLRRLQQNDDLTVVVTGKSLEKEEKELLKDKCDYWMQKPFVGESGNWSLTLL